MAYQDSEGHHNPSQIENNESPQRIRSVTFLTGDGLGHHMQGYGLRQALNFYFGDLIEHVKVYVGRGASQRMPEPDSLGLLPEQVEEIPNMTLSYSPDGSVDPTGMMTDVGKNAPIVLGNMLHRIPRLMQELNPDIIFNFYEQSIGGAYWLRAKTMSAFPLFNISTQNQFFHDYYEFPNTFGAMNPWSLKAYTRLVSGGKDKYAITIKKDATSSMSDLYNLPPIIRQDYIDKVDAATSETGEITKDNFILIYQLNAGKLPEIINWCKANPETKVICFTSVDDRLDFEDFDLTVLPKGPEFQDYLIKANVFVTSAGIQGPIEADMAKTIVLVSPTEGHYEQATNAANIKHWGTGANTGVLDLDEAKHQLEYYVQYALNSEAEHRRSEMMEWIRSAKEIYALEFLKRLKMDKREFLLRNMSREYSIRFRELLAA